jgi:hypothetical protein
MKKEEKENIHLIEKSNYHQWVRKLAPELSLLSYSSKVFLFSGTFFGELGMKVESLSLKFALSYSMLESLS